MRFPGSACRSEKQPSSKWIQSMDGSGADERIDLGRNG